MIINFRIIICTVTSSAHTHPQQARAHWQRAQPAPRLEGVHTAAACWTFYSAPRHDDRVSLLTLDHEIKISKSEIPRVHPWRYSEVQICYRYRGKLAERRSLGNPKRFAQLNTNVRVSDSAKRKRRCSRPKYEYFRENQVGRFLTLGRWPPDTTWSCHIIRDSRGLSSKQCFCSALSEITRYGFAPKTCHVSVFTKRRRFHVTRDHAS